MKLIPIAGQKGKSLLEFYSPEEWPLDWGIMPEMMCQLIGVLESIEHKSVWVFTSHAELLFTDKDDYYKITTAQKKQWHHLTGFADNSDFAAELVIAGLSVSGEGRSRNIFFDSN